MNSSKDYKLSLRKETAQFIIYYSEKDNPCIDKVTDRLEGSYGRIVSKFNQELKGKLIVEIHSEHKDLLKALGFPNGPAWIRGGIGRGKILIASPLNPPYGSDFNGVVNTAIHEFAHKIIHEINSSIPRWLDEGIASYEAKDNNENWIRNTIINGLKSNRLPKFKDLETGDDFELFFSRGGYQYSYTIVEFIIEEFGYRRLIDFVKSPNSYFNVFGSTEVQLEEKWIAFIRRRYQ